MEQQLNDLLSDRIAADKTQMPGFDRDFQFKAEFIEGLSMEQYHADRTRINASSLKRILRSAKGFKRSWTQPDTEESDAYRIGRAVHLAALEPKLFKELYVVEPEFIGLTKDGKPTKSANSLDVQRQRSEWRSKLRPDALILTQQELIDVTGMIEGILEHPVANKMLSNGIAESTIKWTDRETGVMCRGRPDYLTFDPNGDYHLIDIKTSHNITEGFFDNDIAKLQYLLSMAFYADGLMEKFGRLPVTISFFAVEKTDPYEADVITITDEDYELGQRQYRDALDIYARCIKDNKWPARSSRARLARVPQWAHNYTKPEYNWE